MKTFFAAAIGLCVSGSLHAGAPDPKSLTFGAERIGLPPLSLAESIAQPRHPADPHRFGARLPTYSGDEDRAPLAPNLVPKSGPNLADLEAARRARAPQISRESGMPVLQPSAAVDYRLTLVPPDPDVDFKMVVKDVSPKKSPDAAK